MRTTPRRAVPGGRRRFLSALLLLAAALGTLSGAAPEASAHAALRSSDPAEDSLLTTAPARITLTFSEGIGISADSVRVFDPANRRADKGEPEHVPGEGDAAVRVALRDRLPQGTFTVAWRGVSADSHPVAGAFVFSVGRPSGTGAALPDETPGDGLAGALYTAVRYVAYAGYAVLAGVSAFVLLCWPDGAGLRRLRGMLAMSWWAMVAASAAQLALRAPYTSAEGDLGAALDASEFRRTLGTEPGAALVVRLVLLAVAGGLLLLAGRRPPGAGPPGPRRRRGLSAAAGLLATGVAVSWAATEHASTGVQTGLSVPLDVLHLLAVAVWLGGLAALLVALPPAGPAEGRRLRRGIPASSVDRFSRLAAASVAVLAATGLYQSWRQVGSWDALLNTAYGQVLLVKVAAIGLMPAAAGCSRARAARLRRPVSAAGRPEPDGTGTAEGDGGGRCDGDAGRNRDAYTGMSGSRGTGTAGNAGADGNRDGSGDGCADRDDYGNRDGEGDGDPGDGQDFVNRRGLRRSVGAEAAVAVVVLAVTTLLTGTQPGRSAAEESAPPGGSTPALAVVNVTVPFDTGAAKGSGTVHITLDPGGVGGNNVQVAVLDSTGGFVSVPELKVTFTMPGRGIGPLDAGVKDIGGYWSADGVRLPFPGEWAVSVTVRTTEIDQVTETKGFTLR